MQLIEATISTSRRSISERVAEFLETTVGPMDGVYVPQPSIETITRVAEVIVEDAETGDMITKAGTPLIVH